MPTTNLMSRIRAEAQRQLPADAGRLLVGVSGGPDSLCLADVLLALGSDVVLAHMNHALRGADADADAAFVQAFAAERNVAVVLERVDVAAAAREARQSIELAAREARQVFFARAARAARARAIVLAHTADDQAETVLMRLLRGTGLEGLRAMSAQSALPGAHELALLRPLLRVTRAEIERYCADAGLLPRHDASNDSLDHTRNRVRHELLPVLQQFNPGIKQVLARLADSAGAELDVIAYATNAAFAAHARQQPSAVTVDRAAWRALPEGLQRALLRESVRRIKGELTNLNFAAVEEARDVLNSAATTGDIALMSDVRIIVRAPDFVVTGER